MLSPWLVLWLPVANDTTTKGALDLISYSQIEESSSGQIERIQEGGGEPLIERAKANVFPSQKKPFLMSEKGTGDSLLARERWRGRRDLRSGRSEVAAAQGAPGARRGYL